MQPAPGVVSMTGKVAQPVPVDLLSHFAHTLDVTEAPGCLGCRRLSRCWAVAPRRGKSIGSPCKASLVNKIPAVCQEGSASRYEFNQTVACSDTLHWAKCNRTWVAVQQHTQMLKETLWC
jgi:hypothetical protein